MRVLIVEDEADLAEQLTPCAERGGLCRRRGRGRRAARFPGPNRGLRRRHPRPRSAERWTADRAASVARQRRRRTPVLVLTARGSWHEKVQGIDGGADDYVAKPFQMEEVLARLRALIRRASGQVTPELRAGRSCSIREARASPSTARPSS